MEEDDDDEDDDDEDGDDDVYYSLLNVSSKVMLVIRGTYCINTAFGIVTLKSLPFQ